MSQENMLKIQSGSRRLRVLFTGLIWLIPVFTVLFWLMFNSLPEGFKVELPARNQADLTVISIGLGILISILPLGAVLYILNSLKRLFTLYEQGTVFARDNVQCFQQLGKGLIGLVFANLLFTPLLSLVISFSNPEGQRVIVAEMGSVELGNLLIGIVVLLIARVMKEAVELEAERALTV